MALKRKLAFSLPNQISENNAEANSSERINVGCPNLDTTSKYFRMSIAEQFISIELEFNRELSSLIYDKPVEVVYNPIEYAFEVHKTFIYRYLNTKKKILFLGMNPGPFGMGQTGVPFGSVPEVRDWLQINGEVKKPTNEITSRPILGFNSQRTEISGKRFWGLFKELCGSPENFFRCCFVHNLCPLLFLTKEGKNVTPTEIKGEQKNHLLKICERWLLRILQFLDVELIIGIGRFAQDRALRAVKSDQTFNKECKVEFLPHPSPRSVGNNDWNSTAMRYLTNLNLIPILKSCE